MMNYEINKSFIGIWKYRFAEKNTRNEFLIVIAILVLALISLTNFLLYNELRNGVVFTDPILNLFSPVDVTWITFLIIYSALLIAIIVLIKDPELLEIAFLSYAFTAFIRIAAMYSLPLNPPADIIPLNDPFVQLFGSGNILLKDLFFSGHTSTLFLLFLIVKNKMMKTLFLSLTVIVAACVLIQHVHYTIDVLAAPFFTYAAYKAANRFHFLIKKFVSNKM